MLRIKVSLFIIFSIITYQTNHAMKRDEVHEVEELEKEKEELTASFNKMNLKIESKNYNDKASLYLFNMIQSGKNLHLINQLLNKKADPNIQDFWGWAPLHYACKKGLFDEVVALLTHKNNPAYPNIKNKEGKTSLFYACEKNFIDIVKILLENKADPNIQEVFGGFTKSTIPIVEFGKETFHTLAFNLPIKIFNTETKKFIKKLDENSVLHRACYKNNVALVALLLEHKADPHIKNHQGFNPIKYTQNPIIIDKLLKTTTIIPLIIDFDNNTILHLASKYNKKEWAIQFLNGFNDKNLELSVKRLIATLNTTSKTKIFIFVASLRRVAILKLKTKIPKNIILLFVFALKDQILQNILNLENTSKETALNIARKNKKNDMIEYLESYFK